MWNTVTRIHRLADVTLDALYLQNDYIEFILVN
jgi:hypothetical protein